jgi:hypothetical protein
MKRRIQTALRNMTQAEFASKFKNLHQYKVSKMVAGDFGEVFVEYKDGEMVSVSYQREIKYERA